MPEYPDVTVYVEALTPRVCDQPLEEVWMPSPFLLRTFDPPLDAAVGRSVVGLRRLGKRIVFELDEELFLIFHLMIAGRFRWRDRGARPKGRNTLATFDFPTGTLLMTEAGSKKRASLHVVQGEAALAEHDPGGLELFDVELERFRERLTLRNHTLKRALTDPRLFSGIGNAYSDEILHRAQLSPIQWTQRMKESAIERLFGAVHEVLEEWTERLRNENGDGFPDKVTAFHDEMAVHGRFGKPCPTCGDPVQRIQYASNETNYCATCQTDGKLLADRGMSRLLKKDWPRTLEELEAHKRDLRGDA